MNIPVTIQNRIEKYVREIEETSSHEEQLQQILKTYLKSFPVLDSYLYRYSPLGYIAEGIIYLSDKECINISTKRDDIRVSPAVLSALQERRAKYYSGMDYIKKMGTKFVFSNESGLVVPITLNMVVLGYIASSQFDKDAVFDDEMLSSLTYYGQLVGKIIYNMHKKNDAIQLSNRELEVMKRISYGETTAEMADAIGITELTVKQYVKTAMKKLGVQNRTHAVSELFRKGIIS